MLAISHGARYRETSALTGDGVMEALAGLARSVLAAERDGWRPEDFREQPGTKTAEVRMRPLSGGRVIRDLSLRLSLRRPTAKSLRKSFRFRSRRGGRAAGDGKIAEEEEEDASKQAARSLNAKEEEEEEEDVVKPSLNCLACNRVRKSSVR